MNKEESLSDEVEEVNSNGWDGRKIGDYISVDNAREKIQNAQRRLTEVINMEWGKGMNHTLKEVKEIFKEEFGDKLTGAKQDE